MKRAMTLVEMLVVIFVAAIFVLFFLIVPRIARAREESRKRHCAENLRQVGEAMIAYRQDNGGYFPFCYGPANGTWSSSKGSTDLCDAATSLGCLYPKYVTTAKLFHCPSTEDQPSFVVNTPTGVIAPGSRKYLWSQRNSTLTGNQRDPNGAMRASSYGYDPRITPRAVSEMAIMGDWDGTWRYAHDTPTTNHDGGQNVLYADGSVRWQGWNYSSNDRLDNIFAEGGNAVDAANGGYTEIRVFWNCDTDSWLVNGSAVLTQSYEEPATTGK